MKPHRSEEGFSLMAVLGLALLAMFAAYAALRMFQQESKALVSTMNRDRLEQALDAGLDKAVFALNQTGGWNSVSATAYYSSVIDDTTAFNDLNGVKYWVKVLPGRAAVPSSSAVFSKPNGDTNANALAVTGDITFDRTVIITARAVSPTTSTGKSLSWTASMGVSLTAMAYLHRNDVLPLQQVGGVYGTTSVNMGGASAGSYNSCATPQVTPVVTACNGSLISQGTPVAGGGTCLVQPTPPAVPVPWPTNAVPASGTIPWNIEHTVTGTYGAYTAPNGNNTYTYTLLADTNLTVGNVDLNNDDFFITTNGHKLSIYCNGTFGASGNPGWYVDDPTKTTGGHASLCWVYVIGSGAVSLGGTGNYELVMIAPQSTVNIHGTGDLWGAVVANVYDKNGASGKFRFDECILQQYKANTYSNPPIVNAGWYQF